MRIVRLGKTGLMVSRMCFGTLTLGPLQANLPLEQGTAILAHAMEQGINFFDTAQLYQTYPYIRQAMRKTGLYNSVICSKTYAYTRALAQEAVEQARKELDRDYIDIFMLHEQESIHTLNGHREALEYLYECRQKGIIRAVGASMHHIAAVYGATEKELDVIHPLINVAGLGIVDGTREMMETALRQAHAAGIGIFAMKALGGGNLFKQAQACLHYALSQEFIHSVAIGMQSISEVAANIHFWQTGSFSPQDQRILAEKKRLLHIDDWCEGCGICAERCPQSALRLQAEKAVCLHEKCVLCGYCAAACPAWAIKVV